MKQILEKIIEKDHLTMQEAYEVMMQIMAGEINNGQLAGFLTALKTKGETAEELAGFVKAMRANAITLQHDRSDAIDVCGTGGDASGTFNISTAVAFVVAGAGVPIAKHGNRSISSKCGSADVLQQLGIDIGLSAERASAALNELGIVFLFAPQYHPAMRFAGEVRRQLAIKTVFNLLGPLSNPAGVKRQLVGVFNLAAARSMCDAAAHLDMEHISFVCTDNRYDEVLLHGTAQVFERIGQSTVKGYALTAKDFGYSVYDPQSLHGGDAEMNAEIIVQVLRDKKQEGPYYTIAANAALALQVSGRVRSVAEGCALAEESILSGAAYAKLVKLQELKG